MRSFTARKHKSPARNPSSRSNKGSSGAASACRRIDPETGEVTETFIPSRQRKIRVIVSPAEIEAARTPAGGWKRETLAGWGVRWPPRRGWKRKLIEEYEKAAGKSEKPSVHPSGKNKNLATAKGVGTDPQTLPSSGFLIRMRKDKDTERLFIGSQVAHLWNGNDTACRMWSTSEMSRETTGREFVVYEANPGLRICQMCQSNAEKPSYARAAIWGDKWED